MIPVPDEDEELIPASMPEPVGPEEPTPGPGPELEQQSRTRIRNQSFMFLWEIRNIKSMWQGAINPTFPPARVEQRSDTS